jgi:hypothetical protein
MDEGTLLHCVLTLVENDLNPSLEKDLGHIFKWSQSIARGHDMFTRDLLWERSRVKPKPIAFAIMANGEAIVQVAHGFGHLALEQEEHPSEGLFGCFLGDRTVMTLNGETVIQDPEFVVFRDDDAVQAVQLRTAANATIKKMGTLDDFIKSAAKGALATVPMYLPLPLSWVPYLLETPRTNKEAYLHYARQLGQVKPGNDEQAEGLALAMNWFKAACTRSDASPSMYCSLDVSTRSLPRDKEIAKWTLHHLQAVVPRPSRPPTPVSREVTAPVAAAATSEGNTQRTEELYTRILALSDTVMTSHLERERPTTETAKKLSEVELCRLLGFCGLSWQEKHLLPPIWANLKQQPDRASREAVLAAFFAELAKTEPSLRNFSNQALFDDIVNHRFLPGDSYETCHKGFSPLAFIPRTHADVHEENLTEAYYNEANVKTVAEVRKHRTKGPPPIPTNDADLLRLNARDVAILTGFFTPWSSLVQQETELNNGLHEQQMDLFSRPDSTREMIPQLLWAKIKARRNFFLTTCTREMLDVPPDRSPKIAQAHLSAHSVMFLTGTKVSIVGVPHEWLEEHDKPAPAKRAKGDSLIVGPALTDPRYDKTNFPWGTHQEKNPGGKKPSGITVAGANPSQPLVFAQSSEIQELLRKHPYVQLGMVAVAAGFSGPSELPTEGLQKDSCLRWLCFGSCQYPKCKRNHPKAVANAAASKLYNALLPGIQKLTEQNTLPPAKRY